MKLGLWLLGIVLLPFCVASSLAVWDLVKGLHSGSAILPPPARALVGGFSLWVVMFYTLPHPVRTYVLAHELTHALWASLMGVDVSGLSVGKCGGSVTLSRNNVLITLAPYFFPLYTVLVMGAYYLLSLFFHVERYVFVWLALVGFSWGFHFTFTLTTLLQSQPDIQEYGHLFSYVTIYLLNVLGIALWIVMVSPATLEEMISLVALHSGRILEALREPLRGAYAFVAAQCRTLVQ